MSELNGQAAELRATIHVTRKDSGEVDTYVLIGQVTPEQHQRLMETMKHRVHGTSGAMTGPGAAVNNQAKD